MNKLRSIPFFDRIPLIRLLLIITTIFIVKTSLAQNDLNDTTKMLFFNDISLAVPYKLGLVKSKYAQGYYTICSKKNGKVVLKKYNLKNEMIFKRRYRTNLDSKELSNVPNEDLISGEISYIKTWIIHCDRIDRIGASKQE